MDEDSHGFYVREKTQSLVQLDAAAPLTIKSALGEYFSAPNVTPQQFIGDLPVSNVGEYDTQLLLPQLKKTPAL